MGDKANRNVCATTHCSGALLTMSFFVKSPTVIKCYLWWNGQGIRFFPEDITTTMAKIFDLDKHGNREFLENEQLVTEYIESMQRVLRDNEFKGFQLSYQ